jgi:hypothetical protein
MNTRYPNGYLCDGCGKQDEPAGWLAVRLSGDRRGLEIRRFEHGGTDARYFCSEACAFRRISELLAGRWTGPAGDKELQP